MLSLAMGATLLRSLVFVLFEQSQFDGDQAVFGIMALQLSKASAFPLYMYGQGYLLAVSVWLAAPFVAVLGPSVAALKLPLLLLNLLVVALLLRGLVRECDLSPAQAGLAAVAFCAAPVVPAALLVQHQGAIIEPFVWILLVWALRRRPVSLGLVSGIGCLNRPFTVYGLLALAVVALVDASRAPRAAWPRLLRQAAAFSAWWAAAFTAVLAGVAALRPLSTYPSDWKHHFGFGGWPGVASRLRALGETMLPALAGGSPGAQFGIATQDAAGIRWAPELLLAVCALALVAALGGARWAAWPRLRFPVFLVVSSTLSLAAYAAIGVGLGTPSHIRYVVLALLMPVGLVALALVTLRHPLARAALLGGLVLWTGGSAVDHGRLIAEYLTHPPPDDVRELIAFLEGRGFPVGLSDYTTANTVSYLSGERVRLGARGVSRIQAYRALLRERRADGVGIVVSAGCRDGTRVAQWCVVNPPAPLHYREAAARAGP